MAKIIPRIFQIMDASAVTARTLQGMARVRSGQAPAWPLVSDRSAAADTVALETGGAARTFSGPSRIWPRLECLAPDRRTWLTC